MREELARLLFGRYGFYRVDVVQTVPVNKFNRGHKGTTGARLKCEYNSTNCLEDKGDAMRTVLYVVRTIFDSRALQVELHKV